MGHVSNRLTTKQTPHSASLCLIMNACVFGGGVGGGGGGGWTPLDRSLCAHLSKPNATAQLYFTFIARLWTVYFCVWCSFQEYYLPEPLWLRLCNKRVKFRCTHKVFITTGIAQTLTLIIYLAHTCNVWAVWVFKVLKAAFSRSRHIFLVSAIKEKLPSDVNVIWQECSMVHTSHLIYFLLTLTYFQGRYRSMNLFRMIHNNSANYKVTMFQF
jgi:hypothetical protein